MVEVSNDAEMSRMEATLFGCTKRVPDEYNKAHRSLLAHLLTNYRRRIFRAHDLKNVRAFVETPGDPLTKTNAAGFVAAKQVPDPVYKFDPDKN